MVAACRQEKSLTSESVEGASLPLKGIDHIHGGDGLPLGVLGVGDSVPDDVLKEHLEDTTGLLVDEARDTLDSSTTRQPPDGGLGDALDVVSQHLPVTLSASLSQSLSSFATSGHVAVLSVTDDPSPMSRVYIPSADQSQLPPLICPLLQPPDPDPNGRHSKFGAILLWNQMASGCWGKKYVEIE